jgi:hypothetical protein
MRGDRRKGTKVAEAAWDHGTIFWYFRYMEGGHVSGDLPQGMEPFFAIVAANARAGEDVSRAREEQQMSAERTR